MNNIDESIDKKLAPIENNINAILALAAAHKQARDLRDREIMAAFQELSDSGKAKIMGMIEEFQRLNALNALGRVH